MARACNFQWQARQRAWPWKCFAACLVAAVGWTKLSRLAPLQYLHDALRWVTVVHPSVGGEEQRAEASRNDFNELAMGGLSTWIGYLALAALNYAFLRHFDLLRRMGLSEVSGHFYSFVPSDVSEGC